MKRRTFIKSSVAGVSLFALGGCSGGEGPVDVTLQPPSSPPPPPVQPPPITAGGTTVRVSTAPSYIGEMAPFEVRQLSGPFGPTNRKETIRSVTPQEWIDADPAGNAGLPCIVSSWSGGGKGVGTKLVVHGGGHDDSANNGVYVFDFNGSAQPTGWTLPVISSVSSAVQTSETYSDGKPTSVHTYDSCVRVGNEMFRFGGAWFSRAGPFWSRAAWKVNVDTGAWTRLADIPVGYLYFPFSVAYDAASDKFLVVGNATQSFWFYDRAANTWSAQKTAPVTFATNGSIAYDSLRRRAILLGYAPAVSEPIPLGSPQSNFIATPDWKNETVDFAPLTPTGSVSIFDNTAQSIVYDGVGDCFWIWGGYPSNTGRPGYSSIFRMNASSYATTQHPFLNGATLLEQTAGSPWHYGSYGRWVFMDQWRAIGVATSVDAAPYVVKLPG